MKSVFFRGFMFDVNLEYVESMMEARWVCLPVIYDIIETPMGDSKLYRSEFEVFAVYPGRLEYVGRIGTQSAVDPAVLQAYHTNPNEYLDDMRLRQFEQVKRMAREKLHERFQKGVRRDFNIVQVWEPDTQPKKT